MEGENMSIMRPEGGWKIARAPVHPGEMLREEFMKPLGISINGLALELHVPVTRISQIVNARRGITADTVLRLARHFGTTNSRLATPRACSRNWARTCDCGF